MNPHVYQYVHKVAIKKVAHGAIINLHFNDDSYLRLIEKSISANYSEHVSIDTLVEKWSDCTAGMLVDTIGDVVVSPQKESADKQYLFVVALKGKISMSAYYCLCAIINTYTMDSHPFEFIRGEIDEIYSEIDLSEEINA